MDSVGGRKRPHHSRNGRRQRGRTKQLKCVGDSPNNPPLWVKLNFKLEEVPSLVDTGAKFSCISRDVIQTLVYLGVKAKNGSCSLSCHLANGMRCDVKKTAKLHFYLEAFVEFQFKI